MQKSRIAKWVSIIFSITLVIGIVGLFLMPTAYDLLKDNSVMVFKDHSLLYKVVFYLCYMSCLGIVYELSQLFKFIYTDTPFKKEVENTLKICAVIFMILSLMVAIKIIFIPNIFSFAFAFICFVTSLSFYCLAEVIKSAIVYKNEVDFTV